MDQIGINLEKYRIIQPIDGSTIVDNDSKKTRISRSSSDVYTAIAASSDPDRLKSKRLMDSELQVVLAAAPTINAYSQRAEQRTRRLMHNLKSLTAKSSQEIFALFQQQELMAPYGEALEYVEREVRQNPSDAARAMLSLLKYQAAQKAEYSAFDKLSGKIFSIQPEAHDIHRVLMNVFYLFFGDFIASKVRVNVEETRLRALFDYESIHACIYFLVENSSKYCMRGSSLVVSAEDDKNGYINVAFVMESLAIELDEEERVFLEGVSGALAIESGLHGGGVGLFLAREMARINGGNLFLHAGRKRVAGKYARNKFVLSLKKP